MRQIICALALLCVFFGIFTACDHEPKEPDEVLEGKVWKYNYILILYNEFCYAKFDGTGYEIRTYINGLHIKTEKGTYTKTPSAIFFKTDTGDDWTAKYSISGSWLYLEQGTHFTPTQSTWAMHKIPDWEIENP